MVVGDPLAGKGHTVPGDDQDGHHVDCDDDGAGHHGHHEAGDDGYDLGHPLAGKGHLVPVDGDGDGRHQEDGDAGQSDGDDENLSAISLRASPRTLSDWCREASALK